MLPEVTICAGSNKAEGEMGGGACIQAGYSRCYEMKYERVPDLKCMYFTGQDSFTNRQVQMLRQAFVH